MKDAMQMVREALGEDAIIVATREESGGKGVSVTAAIEQIDHYEDDFTEEDRALFFDRTMEEPTPAPSFSASKAKAASMQNERDDWLQYDDEDEQHAVAEQLTEVMLKHAVPEDITDQVISCASVLGMDHADVSLIAAIEHLFSFQPLPQQGKAKPMMLVGPPGAGKTLATAKLAARAVMNGARVAVISTDTVRAGGVEQLSAFTRILRVDLQKASSPQQLGSLLENLRGADQIYIDTGGGNPFNPEEMRDVARMLAVSDIEPVLVLPAALDAEESGEIARAYATLGVRSLLPTRLDIARRLGGILSAAHHGGLIFADASHTPKVADGLLPLSPKRLSSLLMPSSHTQLQDSDAPQRRKQKATAG